MHRRLVLSTVAFGVMILGCPSSDDTSEGGGSQEGGSQEGTGEASTTDGGESMEATSVTPDGSSSGGLITNGCGTFDPNEPGDSVIPQDPDDPEIVSACTTLCVAMSTVADCTIEPEACLELCSMRSCAICPGTLVPLVECEVDNFDPAACTCEAGSVSCPTPEACSEQEAETGFCGG